MVTGESVWRAIVLYGANSATYKFPFGETLLQAAATGRTHVTLDELAPPYAKLLCEALRNHDRQGIATNSRFLDACRAFNADEQERSRLRSRRCRMDLYQVVATSGLGLASFVSSG